MIGHDRPIARDDVEALRVQAGLTLRAWADLVVERSVLASALWDATDPHVERALAGRLGDLVTIIDDADRARVDTDHLATAATHASPLFDVGEPLSVESTALAIASARLRSRQNLRKKGPNR